MAHPHVVLDVIAALLPSGGIGRYVSDLACAENPDGLATAMIEIWRSCERREALGAAGRARAARYDRESWVRAMFAVYEELLAAGPRRATRSRDISNQPR